jgi:hypothetical protein
MPKTDAPQLADQPRRAGVEGRTQRRYRCRENHIVRLAIRPSFQNFPALVQNVSATGIGILFDRPLERGTVLAFSLTGGLPGMSLVREARVMQVRRHMPVKNAPWAKKQSLLRSLFGFFSSAKGAEERIWLIGCRLNPPLSEEELQILI